MSIKHLRTLVAIADHRTFSEAADSVFLTHAAVSQQMRALEAEMEVSLFDRSTRTPRLNATGRALVEKSRQLLRDYDNLIPDILDQTNLAGEFVLGAIPTTLTTIAPRAISALKRSCPQLHLQIRPGLTNPLITALERHTLDAALLTKPVTLPPDLSFVPISDEPLRLIASQEADGDDPLQLLQTQPFIRFNRDAVVGNQIEAWIQRNGIRVNEAMELDNLDAISSMVHANLGVSIVPQTSVPPFNPLPLQWLDLGPTTPVRVLGLAYQSDTTRGGILKEVLDATVQASESSTHPTETGS